MPNKVMRSIIQETFPLDLRVEIDLLSRKRGLTKPQKKEQLIFLLKKYNITDFTQLGPGTNRYSIKYKGFVFKFATDSEGKMDNKTEFKMAKRLYPYVIQCHDILDNGTILVCEYIQVFESYGEMYAHKDAILKILRELSSVFFIGDVGISNKNYANWGKRIGSNDPVCLDFAYIYEVSTNLFVCKQCNTNSLLVPTDDFNELQCPNPQCGHKYTFEELRGKISNKAHLESLGDLANEGYVMTEPTKLYELDPEKSDYLKLVKKGKKKKKHPEVEEVEYQDNNVYDLSKYQVSFKVKKEEQNMSAVIRVLDVQPEDQSRVVNPWVNNPIKEETPEMEAPIIEDDTVMSCDIAPDSKIPEVVSDIGDDTSTLTGEDISDKVEFISPEEDVVVTPEPEIDEPVLTNEQIQESVDVINEFDKGPNVVVKNVDPVEEVKPEKDDTKLNKRFTENIKHAVSRIANTIGYHIQKSGLYFQVAPNLKNKHIMEGTWYKEMQNCIYRSLTYFVKMKEERINDPSTEKGYRREWKIPEDFYDADIYPTLKFIDRYYSTMEINTAEADEVMDVYKSKFTDYLGIDQGWIPCLLKKVNIKIPMDKTGTAILTNFIKNNWCAPKSNEEVSESEESNPAPEEKKEIKLTKEEEEMFLSHRRNVTPTEPVKSEEGIQDGGFSDYEGETEPLKAVEESTEDDEFDAVAFGAEIAKDMLAGNDSDNDDDPFDFIDDDDEDEDDEDETEYIYIGVYMEDEEDVIVLNDGSSCGDISIPFYTNLENVNPNQEVGYSINGKWNWLQCLPPDLMFYADKDNVQEWLSENDSDTDNCKFVVMNENSEDPNYIIGIYMYEGIFVINDDSEPIPVTGEIVDKVLVVLNQSINPNGNMSFRRKALAAKDMIYTEEYIRKFLEGKFTPEELQEAKEEAEETLEAIENLEEWQKVAVNATAIDPPGTTVEPVVEEIPAVTKQEAPMTFQPIRRKKH